MKRNAKIGLYYIFMFFMMCTLIYLIELKSNYDVSQSYEKSEYSDFVLVPKNLEVLGTTSNVNFFKVIYETLTDELLMVLFLIISTIPLIIYYSAKYIERLDEETNELIDISNTEYLETKESAKEKINKKHKMLFDSGYLNYKYGIYAGMLSEHMKMKDVFVGIQKDKNNSIVFEQDSSDIKYIEKIIKGISYSGESIVVVDNNNEIYEATSEELTKYGYDVKKIDFCMKESQRSFKRNKENLKINILDYFKTESELISLANIIAKGNSHATKMLASLLLVTINDSSIANPTINDVWELSKEGLESVSSKVNYVKSAYNLFNELILLDNNTKKIILDEVRENLERLSLPVLNPKDIDDNKVTLDNIKSKSEIFYLNIDENLMLSSAANIIFEAVFNVSKRSAQKNENSKKRKVFLINKEFDKFSKYSHISDRLKDSNRYGLFYIFGINNVKNFKEKYEYDVRRILDYMDIKIFFAIRQYETTVTLKEVLASYSINEVANIINSLDTNRCLVSTKDTDYIILNIDEPNGMKYDKYNYSEVTNVEAISKMKNKDVKLKVNYLDEFEERVNNKVQKEKEEEREKALNFKPELTKEEKEYIADLLKEKKDDDKETQNLKDKKEVYESHEDNELEDMNTSISTSALNMLYNVQDKTEDEVDIEEARTLVVDEEIEKEVSEILNGDVDKNKNREAKDKKENILRTEKDINESIEKLTEMQNKFEKLVKEEKSKATHALYEQMKNL